MAKHEQDFEDGPWRVLKIFCPEVAERPLMAIVFNEDQVDPNGEHWIDWPRETLVRFGEALLECWALPPEEATEEG